MSRMTSTGINIGLSDDGRSSSRVLRPPGGGHTDIFGGGEDADSKVRRYHGRNVSSILEGTNSEKAESQPSPVNETSSGDVKANPSESLPQSNGDPPAAQAQARARVPPGGYSSGLW